MVSVARVARARPLIGRDRAHATQHALQSKAQLQGNGEQSHVHGGMHGAARIMLHVGCDLTAEVDRPALSP